MSGLQTTQREALAAWCGEGGVAGPGAPVQGALGTAPSHAYGRITGADRDAVLDADRRVARLAGARTTGGAGYAELLEAFRASPMTGMTTVLDLARRKSGYNPLASPEQAATKRLPFLVAALAYGLFTAESFGATFEVDPAKPGSDVGASVDRFIGDDPVAAPVIRRQLEGILQSAVAHPGQTQESELLMEYSLVAGPGCRFTVARCGITLVVVMMPPAVFLTQGSGTRSGFELTFDGAQWPARAERILAEHLATVGDWLEATSNVS